MKIQIPEYIQVLIDLLNQNHYNAYVVGGAIRNALLGLPIHDYDLTTDATPDEMLQVFSSYRLFKTGIQHGTITVLSNGQPVEITTFRSENTYEDHRHPQSHSPTTSKKTVNDVTLRLTHYAITIAKA